MKFRSKMFCRESFKLIGYSGGKSSSSSSSSSSVKSTSSSPPSSNYGGTNEIKWEVRPGGMLVQKRDCGDSLGEFITLRVSTVTQSHDISIEATSTFGELKMVLSLVTSLEPREQRLLFKGKEREDGEYLHMVGVGDKDKVLLLEDPAIKDRKLRLHGLAGGASSQQQQHIGPTPTCRTIIV